MKVKIYGAGSIGNHLAHACRNKGWDVLMCDIDPEALERTKNDIYPARYGHWDGAIRLVPLENLPDAEFDLVVIGTPPDTHLSIAKSVLTGRPPKVLLIEKPVCTPSLDGAQEVLDMAKAAGTFACVGYNHTLTENTKRSAKILAEHVIGNPRTISTKFREHWGGIFRAHPWLSGPQDTYLGFWERGGGAGGEHSHAINLWQHLAHLCGMGRIVEVSAMLDIVEEETGAVYDRICLIHVKTEHGFVGDIAQDVITEPAQKIARIQGSHGYIEWICNIDSGHDAVISWDGKDQPHKEMIDKTRPDDFKGEIDYIEQILKEAGNPLPGGVGVGSNPLQGGAGVGKNSPIALERGLDTMIVVAAAHLSNKQGRRVKINYEAGYWLDALEIV